MEEENGLDLGQTVERINQLIENEEKRAAEVQELRTKLEEAETKASNAVKAVREMQLDGAKPKGAGKAKRTLASQVASARKPLDDFLKSRKKTTIEMEEGTSLIRDRRAQVKRAITLQNIQLSQKDYDEDIAEREMTRMPSVMDLFPMIPTGTDKIDYSAKVHPLYLRTKLDTASATASGSSVLTFASGDDLGENGVAGLKRGAKLFLSFGAGAAAEETVEIDTIDKAANQVTLVNPTTKGHNAGAEVRSDEWAFTPQCEIKPEGDLQYIRESVDVKDMAILLRICRQVLRDEPRFEAEMEEDLPEALERQIECSMIYGQGGDEDFEGILSNANILSYLWSQGETGDTRLDAVRRAITLGSKANRRAEFVLMNPCDVEHLELTKGDDGHYIEEKFKVGENGELMVWRLPVIETNVMKEGDFLIGSRRAARLYDRERTEVRMFEEDRDNVQRNMVTVRAEQTLGFVVREPQGFVYGKFDAKPA